MKIHPENAIPMENAFHKKIMRRRFMSVGIHCPILYKARLLLFGFFAERIVSKTVAKSGWTEKSKSSGYGV